MTTAGAWHPQLSSCSTRVGNSSCQGWSPDCAPTGYSGLDTLDSQQSPGHFCPTWADLLAAEENWPPLQRVWGWQGRGVGRNTLSTCRRNTGGSDDGTGWSPGYRYMLMACRWDAQGSGDTPKVGLLEPAMSGLRGLAYPAQPLRALKVWVQILPPEYKATGNSVKAEVKPTDPHLGTSPHPDPLKVGKLE